MEIIEFAGHQVEVKRRAFRKRLGVSVHPDGQIRVSSNKTLSQKQIIKFLESNRRWLEKSLREAEALQQKYPPKFFRSGESYPYLGGDYQLEIATSARTQLKFTDGAILFQSPVPEEQWTDELRQGYLQAFKKSYRQVAEQIMSQRIQFYAHQMQLQPNAVKFRGQKTIWGSCSPENNISLNYKLIVAPIQVVDYVLIHELAHIRHKDHSKRFWALVEKHTPYRHFSKDWLREHHYKAEFLN